MWVDFFISLKFFFTINLTENLKYVATCFDM